MATAMSEGTTSHRPTTRHHASTARLQASVSVTTIDWEDFLEVKPSALAGRGLVTTKDLPPRTWLCRFKGVKISLEESRNHPFPALLFNVCNAEGEVVTVVDGSRTGDENKAKFVNTLKQNQRLSGRTFNTEFAIRRNREIWLRVLNRTVPAGEELVASYGSSTDEIIKMGVRLPYGANTDEAAAVMYDSDCNNSDTDSDSGSVSASDDHHHHFAASSAIDSTNGKPTELSSESAETDLSGSSWSHVNDSSELADVFRALWTSMFMRLRMRNRKGIYDPHKLWYPHTSHWVGNRMMGCGRGVVKTLLFEWCHKHSGFVRGSQPPSSAQNMSWAAVDQNKFRAGEWWIEPTDRHSSFLVCSKIYSFALVQRPNHYRATHLRSDHGGWPATYLDDHRFEFANQKERRLTSGATKKSSRKRARDSNKKSSFNSDAATTAAAAEEEEEEEQEQEAEQDGEDTLEHNNQTVRPEVCRTCRTPLVQEASMQPYCSMLCGNRHMMLANWGSDVAPFLKSSSKIGNAGTEQDDDEEEEEEKEHVHDSLGCHNLNASDSDESHARTVEEETHHTLIALAACDGTSHPSSKRARLHHPSSDVARQISLECDESLSNAEAVIDASSTPASTATTNFCKQCHGNVTTRCKYRHVALCQYCGANWEAARKSSALPAVVHSGSRTMFTALHIKTFKSKPKQSPRQPLRTRQTLDNDDSSDVDHMDVVVASESNVQVAATATNATTIDTVDTVDTAAITASAPMETNIVHVDANDDAAASATPAASATSAASVATPAASATLATSASLTVSATGTSNVLAASGAGDISMASVAGSTVPVQTHDSALPHVRPHEGAPVLPAIPVQVATSTAQPIPARVMSSIAPFSQESLSASASSGSASDGTSSASSSKMASVPTAAAQIDVAAVQEPEPMVIDVADGQHRIRISIPASQLLGVDAQLTFLNYLQSTVLAVRALAAPLNAVSSV